MGDYKNSDFCFNGESRFYDINKSGTFLPLLGLNEENEILHTLSFLAGVMIWSQITDLPISLYSTFVIMARHGFNKQTIWLFFKDLIKGICLAIVLGPPIVSAIIVIVQWRSLSGYLCLAFMFVLSLVMMTIYPVLIVPLFNKFTPFHSSFLVSTKSNYFCFALDGTVGNSFLKESLDLRLRNTLPPSNFL
ncbi:hypothetical protein CXB51_016124 [Gossypium anomalum]|uniref:CAAX prenyl protease 1 N-terminal domain-containing protein n=1 Tax=Gossypium anomalum TaxID=47600 RepID=A0A8J5YIJ2_9ROSI|nr:hypothetical protein CXB51_016124 [Gossypium anomalum]